MSELTPDISAAVLEACQAGAEEAAGALGRALDGEFTLSVGEASAYSADAAPEGFDGSGLAVLFKLGSVGAVAILPGSSGLVPDWAAEPDVTGTSKLNTLAQELGMLLLPEEQMPEDFRAERVESLATALGAAEVGEDAPLVALEIKRDDQAAQLSLIWPLAAPDNLFAQDLG